MGCATNSENSNVIHCHSDSEYLKNKGCTIDELSSESKNQLNVTLNKGIRNIVSHLNPPKYDGGKYKGEITICLNRSGGVEKVVINKPSGHIGLDSAFLNAVMATKQIIKVPNAKCLSEYLYFIPLELNYDETDMAQ